MTGVLERAWKSCKYGAHLYISIKCRPD